jgi:hypothetical protein
MQVFDNYCSPMMGGGEDDYSLDKDKVCRLVTFFFTDYVPVIEREF